MELSFNIENKEFFYILLLVYLIIYIVRHQGRFNVQAWLPVKKEEKTRKDKPESKEQKEIEVVREMTAEEVTHEVRPLVGKTRSIFLEETPEEEPPEEKEPIEIVEFTEEEVQKMTGEEVPAREGVPSDWSLLPQSDPIEIVGSSGLAPEEERFINNPEIEDMPDEEIVSTGYNFNQIVKVVETLAKPHVSEEELQEISSTVVAMQEADMFEFLVSQSEAETRINLIMEQYSQDHTGQSEEREFDIGKYL